MALIDVVKYTPSGDSDFVWKYPSEDLKLGTQVVVNEGQEAIFVKSGVVLDILGAGTHTLSTGNIPLLNKLVNLPFGGDSPFTAEIWFVNKTVKRDLKWGTPSPIPLLDPVLKFPVSVRSFGKWGAKITDSRSFLVQIVGAQIGADSQKIKNYFIGEIIQKLSATLSSAIVQHQLSVMNIAASINQLSEFAKSAIVDEFMKYGLEIVNFNIESINIPDEEMTRIQDVFAKTMEARELSKVEVGGAYAAIKSFEVLNAAANNPGSGSGLGAMLGAGIGLGAGLPMGQQLGQSMQMQSNPAPTQAQSLSSSVDDPVSRLKKLKSMLDDGLITQEIFEQKRDQIMKEI